MSLEAVFSRSKQWPSAKFTNFDKSVTVILMGLIAQSFAIRQLILLGFDTSARIILRSVAEYSKLLVALLQDPLLADEFAKTDVPEKAKKFWENFPKKNIEEKLRASWLKFFGHANRDDANWGFNWGGAHEDWFGISSSITHPSVFGAVSAAIPLSTKYSDENWSGIWGDKAEVSVWTIYASVVYMFPLCLFNHGFPFEGFDNHMGSIIRFDKSSEHHRHVKYGRDILSTLILSIKDNEDFFPEIDLSIFNQEPAPKSC